MPIGVPGKNIPSFPEVNTFTPSFKTKSSGRYSKLGFFLPFQVKIACAPFSPKVTGTLLFKSLKSKTLEDK